MGTGLFFDLAVIAIPVCLYLVLSSFGLIIGALLAWPFRGMLKAHTVAGAIMVFLAIFSLARGDDPAPFLTAVLLLSGLLAALSARWQEGQYAPVGGPGVLAQAGAEVPRDSEVTRALSPRGQGMFPAELADKYSSIEFVGSGGLAHVYRAINRNTGEEVALKIPLRSDETTGKSFMKEIRGWEGLYHPNIVRVNEANILPIPYIEMEYIKRTLADLPKPLPDREAEGICRDLCRVLSYAHEHQVIHRDIKPHNIMIADDGVPKISDWGMSKVMGVPGMPTVTGFSLAYAAPEQLAPETFGETDRRTDIYQLGCVLYELLTGRVPFPGTDMARVSTAILTETPRPPSEMNPEARPLDEVVMNCLAKRPEDRFEDAAELERDLDTFLSRASQYDDLDIFEDS
jgi:serine/threonine protein kinase